MGVALCGGGGPARGLEINSPRDVPPSGYSGRQFVDSAGCVFVRAGVGTSVNWVARVDRGGAHLCGYVPTFGATAVATTAPPAAAPRAAVGAPTATIALTTTPPPAGLVPRPVMPTVAAVPATAPVAVATVASPASPGAYVSPYVAQTGAVAPALPTIVATVAVTNAQAVCPNLSPVAQRYMLSDGRHVVRCGPQTADPVGYINGAGVPGLRVAGVAPAPVAVAVPQGYRAAWDDDRLNPYRGQGSASGAAQMAQMWSDDVPAKLMSAQPARAATRSATHTTLSSKSAAATQAQAPAVAVAAGARFVQVGTFGVPANAEATRARLRALGLPVASAQVVQGGRALQIVYAGPFDGADALRGALGIARGAGFGDAFVR